MQPSTGEWFDLNKRDDLVNAIRSAEKAEEALRPVDAEEVERLKSMSREGKRPALEVAELKKMLAEARAAETHGA